MQRVHGQLDNEVRRKKGEKSLWKVPTGFDQQCKTNGEINHQFEWSHFYMSQLKWSIERAIWKLAQNGQLTKSIIYYIQNCLYQHFFFKRPYLGNETRFCKRVSGKSKPTDGAFIPSFMKVTSPNSFILFRPLFWKRALFGGVPGGPKWAITAQNMPPGPFFRLRPPKGALFPSWL